MSCGVGHRHSSDPELLWLWLRLAVTAQIQPLAWEPPYAVDAALKKQQKQQKQKSERGCNPCSLQRGDHKCRNLDEVKSEKHAPDDGRRQNPGKTAK